MIDYQDCEKRLMDLFTQGDFLGRFARKEGLSGCTVLEELPGGTRILARFPGYKTKAHNSVTVYDYRVDLQLPDSDPVPLSHCNVIVDLYHKAITGALAASRLMDLIRDMFPGVNDVDTREFVQKYVRSTAPNDDLIDEVVESHKQLRKQFNRDGNHEDLTLQELVHSIKWIVLQEDINYPIRNGKEGRKMPLSRYLEAIHASQHNDRKIADVVERALAHYRPQPWAEVDYGTV